MCKILILLSLLVFWPCGVRAQSPALDPSNDVQQVKRQEADAWLKTQIQTSHGNFSKDRYLIVFALNTIQADRNKLEMTAMRRLAFSLLNNSLAAGDQVLPAAWEVDLWDIGKAPITLDSGTAGRIELAKGLQTTHSGKWAMNHDINRSFVSIANRLQAMGVPMQSTIILMFTDSGSISGTTEDIWGMQKPEYVQALQKYGFRKRVDSGFPAVSSKRNIPLNVAIAGFFPQQLKSLPSGGSSRFPTYALNSWQPNEDAPTAGETLPNPTLTKSDTPGQKPSILNPVVLGIIALLVVAAIIALIKLQARPKTSLPAPASATVFTPPALMTLTATLGQNTRPQSFSVASDQRGWWQIAYATGIETLIFRDLSETQQVTESSGAQDSPLINLEIETAGALLLTLTPGCQIERPSASIEASGVDTSRYTMQPDTEGFFYLKSDLFNEAKRIQLKFQSN